MLESTIQIHFDGEITKNHEIPLNVLAKSLTSIESSIHRAYLDIKHKGSVKHRRMKPEDIEDVLFWVGKSTDGGFVLDMVCNSELGRKVVDSIGEKLQTTMGNIEGKGRAKLDSITSQVKQKQENFPKSKPISYPDFKAKAEDEAQRSYATKSILKEYAELLKIIKSENSGKSTLEITLTGKEIVRIDFNREKAIKFVNLLSEKKAGEPVLFKGEITALNKKTKTGKFTNSETKKTATLRVLNQDDFLKVHPLMAESEVEFVGIPIYEYGSIDTLAGDIYFIERHQQL
ncbi:hypothetical protein [Maridesulfovibrio hydrothermalis]|uniref:Uncharacterized protein n=1 Tax=Maridesulfovibrio hydrothermalis AM13 = DSM 14728 TaxID=1121451 RepID=L0R6E7_9BACT|nr:hypothetical protein [Maridesulfovibrio hydrothermalis]CCO22278.1 conserved protein of unknown function [Maridesulfovibrio hydrothermalis AM13 = DSM 14728]